MNYGPRFPKDSGIRGRRDSRCLAFDKLPCKNKPKRAVLQKLHEAGAQNKNLEGIVTTEVLWDFSLLVRRPSFGPYEGDRESVGKRHNVDGDRRQTAKR